MNTLKLRKPPLLETDALTALTNVQSAVKRMMRSLPGPFERPSQLQHCLGIDAKVAWHVYKLAAAKDPLAAAPHVPGRLLMRRIGEAALRKGVPADIVESAQEAISEFDVIVKRHAATRAAFKAIVATVAGDEPAETMALQQRHTAFNMESQLWGEQVDLHYTQAIFRRETERTATRCMVTFKSGLQLLRSDASSVVEGYTNFTSDESKVEPLEPGAAQLYGSSLLPSFCSQPIPQFKLEDRNDGWRYSLLQSKSIGRRGAVDLAFARCVYADSIDYLQSGDRIGVHGTRFLTPTASGVLEMLVHRPTFPNVEPQFQSFGDLTISSMENLIDYGRRLPSCGVLQNIGNAGKAISPPHPSIPRYDEMQDHVFKKLGWDRSEFDLYRVSVSYPILHTMGTIWFKV